MPERTFDDFDEHARDYRSVHSDNIKLSGADSFYFAEMKVRLLAPYEKNSPLKILDLGCGDGATALFMDKYFPAWQVTGIDVSAKSIAEAASKKIPTARFMQYDGSHIPFEVGEFDMIFIAGVFHHVSFHLHNALAQEAYRVLKKGGRLYFFEHNPLNPFTRYLVKTCVFDKSAKLLSGSYSVKILAQNNFHVRQKNYIIFFPRKGWLSSFIFLERYIRWLPVGGQYFIAAIKE